VSPDAGRVPMATRYAERLGLPLVVLHKRRESGSTTRVTHVGGDVADRPCLLIDDMISTGGTIERAVRALSDAGARAEMTIAATHGLLLEQARERLEMPEVREVVVSDSVPPPTGWPLLRVVPIAPLLADAARLFLTDGSVRELA
jgi:ribose-phosphate pyrophosphokinase